MTEIRIIGEAHIESGFERLYLENSKQPSVYVLEGDWYEAEAVDEKGNKYSVVWDIEDDGDLNENNWRSILAISENGSRFLIDDADFVNVGYKVIIE